MPDDRDLIRSRIDLVELVGERVKLTRSGKKWKGLCPFHAEKTPSFYVDSDLQLFHCFGCKKGGDLFAWTIETEGVDFREALELLARRAGVELSRGSGPKSDETRRKLEIMEDALGFYRDSFNRSEAAQVYVKSRAIDADTLAVWQIGFAPSTEYALGSYLGKKKHALREAQELSLLTGTPDGYLDFFRGRLMFPIRDEQGRLVGFSGRSIDGSDPKYMNSRESSLFHKGSTLFGLHHARPLMKEDRRAILAEGQMDVIAFARAGLPAVAPLGTALTEAQAQKLKRYCDEVVVAYDGDRAGRSSAEKAFDILASVGLRRSAALLDPGDDPDTAFGRSGAPGLASLIAKRVSPLRYRMTWLIRDHEADLSAPGFWEAAEAELARSSNLLEVDAIIDEISAYHSNAKVDRQAVVRSFRKQVEARRNVRRSTSTNTVKQTGTISKPRAPERLLLLAAMNPEFRTRAWRMLAEEDLIVSDGGRALADALLAYSPEPPTVTRAEIARELEEDMQVALMALDASDDPLGGPAEPLSEAAVLDARQRLLKEKARRQRLRQYEAKQEAETLEEMYGRPSMEQGE